MAGLSSCPNPNPKPSHLSKRLRRRVCARCSRHCAKRPSTIGGATLAVGVAAIAILAALVVAWTYTARFAIQHERERLVAALAALDDGDYDQARTLVRRVLNNVGLPRQEYGTPLFVLGAVKTFDAGNDVVPERRRIGYLVASAT